MNSFAAQTAQLPHVLRLLDDDSPIVQQSVTEALLAFGDTLEAAIAEHAVALTPIQQNRLHAILQERNRRWLDAQWSQWLPEPDSIEKLERGWSLLSGFMRSPSEAPRVSRALDDVATDYAAFETRPSATTLAEFLFRREGFKGTRTNYYAPHNSDLLHVIEHRRGIPISLCMIYQLVGHRVDVPIYGCNYPGHFLCRVSINNIPHVVDCFNGGRILDLDNAPGMTPEISPSIRRMIREIPGATTVLGRALRNLSRAYEQQGDTEAKACIDNLLAQR